MKVRCQICGKEIEKESAFSISKDGKTFYYCSEAEYVRRQMSVKQRIEIVNTYIYCLDSSGKSVYSLVQKEFNTNVKSLGIEQVYYFITKNKEKIKRTIISKQNENPEGFTLFNKIKYITAIIKKQLEKLESAPQVSLINESTLNIVDGVDINIYDTKNKYIGKRRALNYLEDLYGEDK